MSRIEELEKRLAADPNSRIFVQLAEEYRKQGLLENAIEICEQGLTKHAQYPSARVALGRALLEAETFDRASEEFEAVLAQVPDNILANKFLGETYHRLGRYDEALQKYGIAQTLAPEDTELEGKLEAVKAEMAAGGPPPPAADLTAPAEPGGHGATTPLPVAVGAVDDPLEATLVDAQAFSPAIGQEPPPLPVASPPPVPPAAQDPAAAVAPSAEEPPPPPPEELAPIPLVDVDGPMVLESAAESYASAGQAPASEPPVEPVPVVPAYEPPPIEPASMEPPPLEPPPLEPPPMEPPPMEHPPMEPPPMEPPPMEPPPMEPPPMEPLTFEAPPIEAATIEPPPMESVPVEPATPVFEAPPMVEAPPMETPTIEATPVEPSPAEPQRLDLVPEPAMQGDGIETPTMAELYASQGHFDKSVGVYRNLLAREPNETQYLERIEELEMLAKASADSAAAPPPASLEPRGDGSDSGRQQTIEVLEQWLDGIRRSRRA